VKGSAEEKHSAVRWAWTWIVGPFLVVVFLGAGLGFFNDDDRGLGEIIGRGLVMAVCLVVVLPLIRGRQRNM
jgi:hypothetical protein